MCNDQRMTTTTPEIGSKVKAVTTTPAELQVVIEVTAIDAEVTAVDTEGPVGWLVYGYRAHRGARPRQTMYPRLYFVPREVSS